MESHVEKGPGISGVILDISAANEFPAKGNYWGDASGTEQPSVS